MGVMSYHANTVCNLGIEHDQNCLWSASRVVSVIQPSTSNFNPGTSIHDSQLNMLSESDWNPSRLNTSHQNRSYDHNPSNFNTSHLNTYDYNIPSNLNTSHLSTSSDCNNKSNVNNSHLSTSSDYNPSNLALILRTFHPIATIQGGGNPPVVGGIFWRGFPN